MPYSTRSCVVIESGVPFIGFLVQLESFNYTIVNNDKQRRVYELLFEVSSYSETPTPSINHDYTVKIDGVIKINANKVNEIGDNMGREKFSNKMYKHDKGFNILFKDVTILVPLFWTPKLYAILL